MQNRNPLPVADDIIAFALQWLRLPKRSDERDRQCDLYAQYVAHGWCTQREGGQPDRAREEEITAVVMEVAWELVRRGLIRPGGRTYPDNNAADPGRFCLTARGRIWLASADESHFVVMQSGALAQALSGFRGQLGDGYHQRAQEALRCREADAWLATCAMCGAAAESILLSLAIAHRGNAETVIKDYRTATGRKKTIDALVGKRADSLQRPFRSFMGLLSYWRDDASHGLETPISAPEAEEALRQLLMLAQFAARFWSELTDQQGPSEQSG